MPVHVTAATVVPGIGEKVIRELVGNASTGTEAVSVARMTSPPGWEEPAQAPEFDEVTVVLEGTVVVEHAGGTITVRPGEAVLARAGERVRYSTPGGRSTSRCAFRRSPWTPPTASSRPVSVPHRREQATVGRQPFRAWTRNGTVRPLHKEVHQNGRGFGS